MWRSRLYSDVRIALSGNFSSTSHESTTAIFSSHRFILVSRSPYFYDALISWPQKPANGEIQTLTLPSPPFTPASLHFTLGFIYTGTLIFSHRTYDLSTAFAILKAALYLSLPTLHDEVQARIAHEMLHGLFHAFLPFQEYERLTQSKWGTGGCRCRQCARRVPRVLEFSLEDDVKNTHLERGARRALVGLFGEGWCTQEFASLSLKLRESLLKGVAKRTTPQNVFPLLFSAEHALVKLATNIDAWADTVREMIHTGRKLIDELICKESEASFSSDEWMEIMEGDGARFDDSERVQWAMAAVLRGVREPWAAPLYQTLVSAILIKPHPTEPNSPFLSPTSQIRQQVEQARIELLKWISKRWLQIRQEHGFDNLEGWAIKEISDYMEVPIEDLLSPAPPANSRNSRNKNPLRPMSNHPHTSRADADSEVASSMRVSVLSRNLASSRRGGPSIRERERGDNTSVHSSISVSSVRSARSTVTTSSAASDSTIGRSSKRAGGGADSVNTGMSPARKIVQATRARDAAQAAAAKAKSKDRPDSKLTPASPQRNVESRETSPTPQPSLKMPQGDDDRKSVLSDVGGQVEEDENVGGVEEEEDDRASVAASEAPTEPESPVSTSATPKKTLITRASLAGSSRASQKSPTPGVVRNKPSSASVRSQATRKSAISTTSRQSVAKSMTTTSSRPLSRGSTRTSTVSTLSRVSTSRSTSTMSTASTSTTSSRPASAVSTASSTSTANHRTSTLTADSTGTYRTASSGGLSTPRKPRSRKSSTASATSVRTAGRGGSSPSPVSPRSPSRTRKISGASASSVNSKSDASSSAYGTAKSHVSKPTKAPPVPIIDPTKLSPVTATTKRAVVAGSSAGSVRSVRSTASIKKGVNVKVGGGGGVGGSRKVSTTTTRTAAAASAPGSPVDVKVEESLPDVETSAIEAQGELGKEEEMRVEDEGEGEEEGEIKNTSSTITIKPRPFSKEKISGSDHKKTDSTNSTGSNSTIKRKRSNETVIADVTNTTATTSPMRTSRSSGGSTVMDKSRDKPQPPLPVSAPSPVPTPAPAPAPTSEQYEPGPPRGATLEIGIPCIISSKRKRFKAYARYIGEVAGEYGPWVGVEVPIPLGESWADRDVDMGWSGTQWNDGTWGGIRYFEIGGSASGTGNWDYDDRASRRRRVDGASSIMSWTVTKDTKSLKREGDQLSMSIERMKRMRSASPAVSDSSGAESRGLFVRPQQVLYVVDAVEDL
ncbi:hypothetical protein AN958_11914 [Leucoagaricus sp. SymC.cos]|nr:hypothetical protein AN958_11914 [Leucoagaricus sp. SymC.cos]